MQNFAVLGDPIAHSRSPRIHAKFAQQSGIAMQYQAIRCDLERLPGMLNGLDPEAAALQGANLTLPLKQAAASYCQAISARAQRAGAINTIQRRPNGWFADNTDGSGLVKDLSIRHQIELSGKRLLILGAGGAAAGVLPALLDMQVASVCIANRTLARAQGLVARLAGEENASKLSICAWQELAQQGAFDLIINASSAGHQQPVLPQAPTAATMPVPTQVLDLPYALLHSDSVGYDLSYGKAAIPFLSWISETDCCAYDGLGMLVEQAADAFAIWHGVRPDTAPIWAELRAEI